jgi:hypothetical protein
VKAYGERWYRIWHMFLAWSVRIGSQGNAACFQVVSNKNLNRFNRRIYIGQPSLGERIFENGGGVQVPAAAKPRNGTVKPAQNV